MQKITVNYQYNELDKRFEFFIECSSPSFWFHFGRYLAKSKLNDLINNGIEIVTYNFDTVFTKEIHYNDTESLAKKVVKLVIDFYGKR